MKDRKLQLRIVDSIKIGFRYREDLGDIQSLSKSIAKIGLLNPITVTSEGTLLAGHRRLMAVKALGWRTIQCVVADDLDSAISRLTAERDENTERKDMTIIEKVKLGRALETLERPKALARQAAKPKPSKTGDVSSGPRIGTDQTPAQRVRDRQARETRASVGHAVGLSGSSYERAKTIVNSAYDDNLSVAQREVAKAAMRDMETTGNIRSNYEKVRESRKQKPIPTMITKKKEKAEAREQRYAFNKSLPTISGAISALNRFEEIHPEISSEELTQWISSLSETRRTIERIIKRLKDKNNA